jgi:hypothetical protein
MKKTDVNDYFTGGEPRFDTDTSINVALSWYANQMEPKDSKKFTLDHVKKHDYSKEIVNSISTAPENMFLNLGFVCRILENGANLPEKNHIWIDTRINQIVQAVKEPVVSEFAKKQEFNIHDRIYEQSSSLISGIEDEIDKFIKTKVINFNVYEFLTKNEAKNLHAKHVVNHFTPFLNEINIVLEKSDEQLNEAYASYTKKQVVTLQLFLQSIIDDCNKIINNAKITRKPRKQKKVSLTKLISKLKYKKDDNELKLKSINPLDILTAKQLWVYNTKLRKFGVYVADINTTLTVKGTTILNYDDVLSTQKTLRKPEEQLKSIDTMKKTDTNKFFKEIKSKDAPLSGRINEDIILLKVFK